MTAETSSRARWGWPSFALAVAMAIGGSTEMSAEALARFAEGRYDSKTGGEV